MADNYGRFKNLHVWREAVCLAKEVYRATRQFPREELYGLTSQMRRAAVSVASNIAEDSVRRSNKEFERYVEIALGSLAELETQLEIAIDLRMLPDSDKIATNAGRVRQMLYRLRSALGATESRSLTVNGKR